MEQPYGIGVPLCFRESNILCTLLNNKRVTQNMKMGCPLCLKSLYTVVVAYDNIMAISTALIIGNYMKDDVALTAEQETLLDDAIARLQKHEPIQYILDF